MASRDNELGVKCSTGDLSRLVEDRGGTGTVFVRIDISLLFTVSEVKMSSLKYYEGRTGSMNCLTDYKYSDVELNANH